MKNQIGAASAPKPLETVLDLFAESSVWWNLFCLKNQSDIKGICDGFGTGQQIQN